MFCSSCGNPLSDQVRFCPRCGTPVPAAAQQPQRSAPVYANPSAVPQSAPTSLHISFQMIASGGKGGLMNEGYLDVSAASLALYKKSMGVRLAFGVLGSAIEGKGTLFETIQRPAVTSYEKLRKKSGRVSGYKLQLFDGRTLQIVLNSIKGFEDSDAPVRALDCFLTQQPNAIVP